MKPLLVGEMNPYGTDQRYALYPEPEQSAGGRLCRLVLRLSVHEYIRRFDRTNLCVGQWSFGAARQHAAEIIATSHGRPVIVLFGSKVCSAFGAPFVPFKEYGKHGATLVVLPHPSGLCRLWNEPGAFQRAREAMVAAGAL